MTAGVLHPDHTSLLSLAQAALHAEKSPLWKQHPEMACKVHGAACDALWNELRRQIDYSEGRIPVIEHPAKKKLHLARRMRSDTLTAVRVAVEDVLSDMEQDTRG